MSQLYDYFACSRALIERWADALEQQDEAQQHEAEAKMPRLLTLKNIRQDAFNLLAECVGGDSFDAIKAMGEVDLIRAVSVEEGPWVMAFRRFAVEAIGGMQGCRLVRLLLVPLIEYPTQNFGRVRVFFLDLLGLLQERGGRVDRHRTCGQVGLVAIMEVLVDGFAHVRHVVEVVVDDEPDQDIRVLDQERFRLPISVLCDELRSHISGLLPCPAQSLDRLCQEQHGSLGDAHDMLARRHVEVQELA
jgi:uncharacterized protein with GYD domain